MGVRFKCLFLWFTACFGTIASLELQHGRESVRRYSASADDFSSTTSPRLYTRQDAQVQLQALPECTRDCFEQVLPQYGCTAGNDPCFCNNGNLTASLTACVGANCTLAESLPAQRFKADTCDEPVRDRGGLSRRLCWAMFVIATLFVICRFLSRTPALGGQGYSWDDWMVLFCYALLVPTDVTAEIEVQNGLGRDMFMLTVDQVVKVLQMFYLGELFYNVIVMATKISLVLLYLRIWTADSVTPAFRIACWTLVGVLASTATAGAFTIIFQCSPISYTWLAVAGELQGTCIQIEAFTYTYGALNISYDVIVFFLPVHSLLKLKIAWPRKVGVIGAFLVGFLVTICSIVRLQYLVRLDDSKNITWDFQYIGMWSLVEANFSIVCCCMPAMAGLVQRIYARFCDDWESTRASKDLDSGTTDSTQHRRSSPGRVTDVEMMAEKSAQEGGQNEIGLSSGIDQEATGAAIVYRDRPNARNLIEISHEPPAKASRAVLRYRDRYDVLHEVGIIDRPQGNRDSGRLGAEGWEHLQAHNKTLPAPQWQRSDWEVLEELELTSGEPSPKIQRFPEL